MNDPNISNEEREKLKKMFLEQLGPMDDPNDSKFDDSPISDEEFEYETRSMKDAIDLVAKANEQTKETATKPTNRAQRRAAAKKSSSPAKHVDNLSQRAKYLAYVGMEARAQRLQREKKEKEIEQNG